jgi:hypothetical protein
MSLPKVIASCSIRASKHGDSHGGLFVLDFNTEKFDAVLDWSAKIDLDGRGAERGLRGIAIYGEHIIVAASSNILFLDKNYNIVRNESNPCLKYCHEICVHNDTLYMLSTAYDVVLCYDLKQHKFVKGLQINKPGIRVFDPNTEQLKMRDQMHLNSISSFNNCIYVAGTNTNKLLALGRNQTVTYAKMPNGTHNAQPFGPHVLMNNTSKSTIEVRDVKGKLVYGNNVLKLGKDEIVNSSIGDKIARQPFARGIAYNDKYIVGGSSPAMLTLYHRHNLAKIKDVIMHNDIRYTIHGIAML